MPPLILTLIGLVVLVFAAYILVEGASRIAFAFGISQLIVGLTIVAIGTSAPELMVSITSALQIRAGDLSTSAGSEIIIGNVVGSNIANIGLILGFSAFVASINVPKTILQRDFLWLLGVSILVGIMSLDKKFSFWDGVILLIGTVIFSYFQYWLATHSEQPEEKANHEAAKAPQVIARSAFMVVGGIIGLGIGSNWLVSGATEIATSLGVSEFIIGLTLVAVGTSLPELSTSVVASFRGEGELVVGNIIGSNIYNLLLILASAMVITTLEIPDVVRELQIPLMIGLTFALYPIIRSEQKIQRWEGILLLVAYLVMTGLAVILN